MYNNSIIDAKIKSSERLKKEFDKFYDKIDAEIRWYESGKYQIKSVKLGIIDFYIATNTIVLRNESKTVKNGLQWIINNLT